MSERHNHAEIEDYWHCYQSFRQVCCGRYWIEWFLGSAAGLRNPLSCRLLVSSQETSGKTRSQKCVDMDPSIRLMNLLRLHSFIPKYFTGSRCTNNHWMKPLRGSVDLFTNSTRRRLNVTRFSQSHHETSCPPDRPECALLNF